MSNSSNLQSGQIGGFFIGPEFIVDAADSMGIASELTSADDVRFWAGATYTNRAVAPFRVTRAGAIASTSGVIGGWTIGATTLTGGNATLSSAGALTLGTGDDVAIVSAADSTYRLWIGDATAADAPFSVTKSGDLLANSADITGTLRAGSVIEDGVLETAPFPSYTDPGSPDITVNSPGGAPAGYSVTYQVGSGEWLSASSFPFTVTMPNATTYLNLQAFATGCLPSGIESNSWNTLFL